MGDAAPPAAAPPADPKEVAPEQNNETDDGPGSSTQQKGKKNSAPRLSFTGNPGDIGFQRRVEIVKAVMVLPIASYMDKGKKQETFQKVCASLNMNDMFAGKLSWERVRDKFKDAVIGAEEINIQTEEVWIRLHQNGNQKLNELDELYIDLAGHIKEYKLKVEREAKESDERSETANANLAAAMATTRKRYDAASAFRDVADRADASKKTPEKRGAESDGGDSSSAPGSSEKGDGQTSHGAGQSEGSRGGKRSKTNKGLKMDPDSEDPRGDFAAGTGDVMEFLRDHYDPPVEIRLI